MIKMNRIMCVCVCYIWSTLLYGSETWTLTKQTKKLVHAFEMLMLRRILKISRAEHKRKNEALQLAKITPTLLSIIKKRKCKYLGYC